MSQQIRAKVVLASVVLLIVCAASTSIQKSTGQLTKYSFSTATTFVNEVWVDDNFTELTPGWGVTSFRKIQDGINAVVQGGIVHVASGTYVEIIVINKSVFLFGENRNNTIIDGDYMTDITMSVIANNVTIRSFTIQNCIYLGQEKGATDIESWYNDLSDVMFKSNWIDITISGQHNSIDSCFFAGSFMNIRIGATANNSITNCQFTNFGRALSLASSQLNGINGNSFMQGTYAISFYQSSQNHITANFIYNCSQTGAKLESTSIMNIFAENTFRSCYQALTEDSQSGSNTFYHNSFIDNTVQLSSPAPSNQWHDGYPTGGNYWESNSGKDDKRGPNQDEIGSDGIFDIEYTIDANNRDRYPLTKTYGGQNDIGIPSFTCSKTAIPQTSSVNMSVKVVNYGFSAERVHMTLRLNATTLAEIDTGIISRNSTTFIIALNATGIAIGKYLLEAHVNPVANETDTADNTLTLKVAVTFPGDVNGDLTVDIYDAIVVSGAFLSTPQTPGWNPNADINSDNNVDIYDAIILSVNFGRKI